MKRTRVLSALAATTLAACLFVSCSTPTASAPTLLVADLSALSPQDQITYAALEGIVNRSAPQLYLEGLKNGQDFDTDTAAPFWLSHAVPARHRTVSLSALAAAFRSDIRGLVVWDPSLAVDTQDLATTAAGVEGLLPVSPTQAASFHRGPWKLPIVLDLRSLHFTTPEDAYRWGLAHLRPPGGFAFPAWTGGPRNGRDIQPGLRDWIVTSRGFAFEANPMTQAPLVDSILAAFPRLTAVYGYPFFDDDLYRRTGIALGEPSGVGEISRAGDFLIPTADATNLSVLHHFQVPVLRPRAGSPPPRPGTGTPAQTAVCFVLSDGDNVGTDETVLLGLHWNETARGRLPVATSMSPWLARLEPTVYDYYVRTMSRNDSFIASPSGAGYAYPSQMPNLDAYLSQSRTMMTTAGLHAVWILDNGYATSPSSTTVLDYVARLRPPIIFTDYSTLAEDQGKGATPPYLLDGVPVIGSTWGVSVDQTVAAVQAAAASQRATGRVPAVFVGLSTWSMSYAKAGEVMAALGPQYRAVSPTTFASLLVNRGAPPGS